MMMKRPPIHGIIRVRNHKRIFVMEHRFYLLECDTVFCGIG